MKVLVACESSGVVRNAFIRKGHEALSCDLLPSETGGPHYQGSVFDVLYNDWDLVIAHPPCTYLSVSGMHWTTRGLRDPSLTEDAVKFFLTLATVPCPRVCVENPVSIMSSRYRKPDQIIQPYMFGHDASKKTCLWLKGLPKLEPTVQVPGRMVNGKPRWSNQTDSGQNRLSPSADRWKERSRTYLGIAEAMAEQWGGINSN